MNLSAFVDLPLVPRPSFWRRPALLTVTILLSVCANIDARAQQVVVSGVPIGASVTAASIAAKAGSSISVPAGGDIVDAVNYINAVGGGTVNLQAGVYHISQSITPGSNVAIIGQGQGSTIIYAPQTPNGVAMIAAPNGAISNLVVQNLTLDGNIPRGAFSAGGSPYANSGIYLYGNNNTVNNVLLNNVEIRNTGIGMLATVTNSITFNNVYIHDNNPGNFSHNAYLVGCDFVYIVHSRFDAAHTGDGLHFDFSASYYQIQKSEFSNNNGEGILDQGSTNNVIQDTIINANSNDGINLGSNNGLITRDIASYNAGYGYNVPGSTLSDNVYGVGDGQGIGDFVDYIFANLLLAANPSANNYPAILANGVTGVTDTADWVTSLGTPNSYYTTSISGYSTIGAVDFNTNHLKNGAITFPAIGSTATAPTSIALRYSNGTSGTLSLNVSVNGGTPQLVSFAPTGGWSTWGMTSVTLNLNNGGNAITISALPTATANPLLDYLLVGQTPPSAPPPAPTGVKVVANNSYQTTITWNPVPGAQSYNVYRTGGAGFSPQAANLTGTSYTDNYLLLGNNTVSYIVWANNQAGGGPASATVSITTPTDAPAGFQLSQASNGNAMTWMATNGATSYNVRRSTSSGGPYTNIASVTNTSFLDTTAQANTAYYYVVQAIGATVSANSYELSVGLPAGLLGSGPATTAQDIGATGGADLTEYAANSATPSASVYGLAGSGAGIWSTADAFRYVSVPVSGNVTMTARVFYEQAPSAATQAGIDMRETLAPNATDTFVGISGGLGAEALVRPSTGASTSVAALTPGIAAPYWVRMSRVGNVFTGYVSPDGKTWTVLATNTLTMNTQAYIGLGSSSTTGQATAIALFDNVSVTGGYPPFN